MKRSCIALVTICLVTLHEVASARIWTDSTGRYRVEAELVEVKEGMVNLRRKEDERVLEVPLAKLSKQDQE